MKRPPPSFVVEVRRQRRSTNSGGKSWATEPALVDATRMAGRHPGAAALFEPEPKAPLAAPAAPPRPQGRILPSLADIEPVTQPAEEAAAPPRRKREYLGAARKPKTAPEPRPKKESGWKITTPSPRSFEESSIGLWMRGDGPAEGKAKAASPSAQSELQVPTAQPRPVAEAPAQTAPAESVGARQARHRRIMERYALGGELKPGQRWKRRSQGGRK
ncbi:MAG: hypothetical protein ACLPGW_18785 [Roseiarcus sp.]